MDISAIGQALPALAVVVAAGIGAVKGNLNMGALRNWPPCPAEVVTPLDIRGRYGNIV